VTAVVQKWTSRLPESYWSAASAKTQPLNLLPVAHIAAAAKVQLEMTHELATSGLLTPAQLTALLQNPLVFVPVMKAK
jgi:hypothetical protein